MKDNSLTREKFDTLYMRPDVLYIYNLGVALKERAKTCPDEIRSNLMMIAGMFIGYKTKHNRFEQYNLKQTDTLDDPVCRAHIDFLSKETSIPEYYIAILTDMMPYVAFANYLLNTIEQHNTILGSINGPNIWMTYAKKYGDPKSPYVLDKLLKSIVFANHVLDNNEISGDRASELFCRGLKFELYFITEAMEGNLHAKIVSKNSHETTKRIIEMPVYDKTIIESTSQDSNTINDNTDSETSQDSNTTNDNTDSEIIIDHQGHSISNKTAPIIIATYQHISLGEESKMPEPHDEKNYTQMLLLIQKHWEETYGDLKPSFDDEDKIEILDILHASKSEEVAEELRYLPEWLSSATVVGSVIFGVSQLAYQQRAHHNEWLL